LLFDPRPKTRREDLYDFDEELDKFVKALDEPMVLISGLRRTGKTSLILTGLNIANYPYIYLDLREGVRSYADMYKLISRSFSEFIKKFGGLKDQFIKFLSRLRGVSIAGIEVNFSWSPRERPLLTEILDILNDFAERVVKRLVVVFDEMQSVRGSIGFVLQNALAHSYDFNKNICIVLAGSEMGILYNILQNPGNPLYGRAYVELTAPRPKGRGFCTHWGFPSPLGSPSRVRHHFFRPRRQLRGGAGSSPAKLACTQHRK